MKFWGVGKHSGHAEGKTKPRDHDLKRRRKRKIVRESRKKNFGGAFARR